MPRLAALAALQQPRNAPPANLPNPFDAAAMVGSQSNPPLQANGEIDPWVAGFPSMARTLPRVLRLRFSLDTLMGHNGPGRSARDDQAEPQA